MIQRIQSLFLLLAGIAFFLQFQFDFATSNISMPQIFADKQFDIFDNPILLIMTIIGGAVALGSIFLYKNRPLQIRMGYLLIILSILLPVAAFLLMYSEGRAVQEGAVVDDSIGLYLPIVSLIGAVLANRFINKDNKLVKSMDRLR